MPWVWMRSVAMGRTPAEQEAATLGVRAGLAQVLVEQILENRPRTLEAVGRYVGEVVGDDIELGLLGIEAGAGNPEGADHRGLLGVGGVSEGRRWGDHGFAMSFMLDLARAVPGAEQAAKEPPIQARSGLGDELAGSPVHLLSGGQHLGLHFVLAGQ